MNFLTILVLLIILINFLIFIFYKRVVKLTFGFVTIMFFTSALFAISTIFAPALYTNFINISLENSPFGLQLQSLDKTIVDINKAPDDLKNKILNLFRQNQQENIVQESKPSLYEGFVNLIATIFKFFILIISLLVMFVATYFRYAYGGLKASRDLEKRVRELERALGVCDKR